MEKKSKVITSLMIIYVAFFSIGCNVSESQTNKVTQSESLEIQQSLVQENEKAVFDTKGFDRKCKTQNFSGLSGLGFIQNDPNDYPFVFSIPVYKNIRTI